MKPRRWSAALGYLEETMSDLLNFPCWYIVLSLFTSIFHGVRGAVGQTFLNPNREKLPKLWHKVVVLYAHDFLLHFVCTNFGFVCLFASYKLGTYGISQLSPSSSFLFVFLALVGIAGVTGQLAVLLTLGKLPLLK
jgi:hypothetical protein